MNQLIAAMIAQNILNNKTVITASYSTKDSSGRVVNKQDTFIFITAIKKEDGYSLTLSTLYGNYPINIPANNIIAIDGMKPDRFIDVYDINIDGTPKKVGKKRGRKSKI